MVASRSAERQAASLCKWAWLTNWHQWLFFRLSGRLAPCRFLDWWTFLISCRVAHGVKVAVVSGAVYGSSSTASVMGC